MNNDPLHNGSTGSDFSQSSQTPPPKKRCPRCGRELPDDALFCGECGMNLAAGAAYTVPPQSQPRQDAAPLKTGDYVLILFLSSIPLVGLILLLVWSFSEGVNINRRNLCRAQLILMLIGLVAGIVSAVFFASLFGSLAEDLLASNNVYHGLILPFNIF